MKMRQRIRAKNKWYNRPTKYSFRDFETYVLFNDKTGDYLMEYLPCTLPDLIVKNVGKYKLAKSINNATKFNGYLCATLLDKIGYTGAWRAIKKS